MKVIKLQVNSYAYDELSDKAKENAFNNWYNNEIEFVSMNDDYRKTLDVFCTEFDVSVFGWSVTDYDNYYRFELQTNNANIDNFSGIRLAKYIYNNYYSSMITKKYNAISKLFISKDCALTGCCTDDAILQPLFDCVDYKKSFFDYNNLIDTCLRAFFNSWSEELKYQHSKECFEENYASEENYTIDGETISILCNYEEITK